HRVEAAQVGRLEVTNVLARCRHLRADGGQRALFEVARIQAGYVIAALHEQGCHDGADVALMTRYQDARRGTAQATSISRFRTSPRARSSKVTRSETNRSGHPADRAASASRSSSPMKGVLVRSRSKSRWALNSMPGLGLRHSHPSSQSCGQW